MGFHPSIHKRLLVSLNNCMTKLIYSPKHSSPKNLFVLKVVNYNISIQICEIFLVNLLSFILNIVKFFLIKCPNKCFQQFFTNVLHFYLGACLFFKTCCRMKKRLKIWWSCFNIDSDPLINLKLPIWV